MLDSLDQLSHSDTPTNLSWLPTLPPHTRLLISTLPGEEFVFLPALQRRFPSSPLVVPPLDPDDGWLAVSAILSRHGRTLTAAQSETARLALSRSPTPLFATLAASRALYVRNLQTNLMSWVVCIHLLHVVNPAHVCHIGCC